MYLVYMSTFIVYRIGHGHSNRLSLVRTFLTVVISTAYLHLCVTTELIYLRNVSILEFGRE